MHQPTVRVIEVINYILKKNVPQSLANLSRELDIPKSTLLPILQTLCSYGYIYQNSLGQYLTGTYLFSVSTQLKGKFPIMDYIHNKLKSLSELLEETCYFGILNAGNVLYLDKVDSNNAIYMLVSTGKTLPAYSTGIGKALLTDMSKNELEALYPDGLKSVTANTITNFDYLYNEISEAKYKGYSKEVEESTPHIRCLAVPIRKNEHIIAAISVAIPVFRFDEEKEAHIVSLLKNTVEKIEKTIRETDADLIF